MAAKKTLTLGIDDGETVKILYLKKHSADLRLSGERRTEEAAEQLTRITS